MSTMYSYRASIAGLLVMFLAACNLPGSSPSDTSELSNEELVATALAETATAAAGDPQVATMVAATMTAAGGEAPPAADTQAPTTTPPPSVAPSATPSIPIIHVSTNTNCRYGPGVVYDPPVDVFNVGETAQVFGRSPDSSFYYIDKGCYVWTNYVTVEAGNINSVPVFTPVATPSPAPTGPWSGEWLTTCGVSDCETMTLTQNGNQVTGTYAHGEGSLSGSVSGNHFTGTWSRGSGSGTFDFWMTNNQQRFRGNWDRVNEWCGARSGYSNPNPCGVASWYGTWQTKCGASSCDTMILTQNGTDVSGTYAGGAGSVSGTVNGTTFTGTYTRGGSGSFTFYMLSNGSQFQGNWNTTNEWCGYRDGTGHPAPCLKN